METVIAKKESLNLINLDMGSIKSLSQAFKESGLFPDIQSEAQAIVKIVAGQELSLPPVYSMQNFYIIKGKLSMAAEVMGLILKRTQKYNYRVKEHIDDKCAIQFSEDGKEIYLSTFTIADAKRAGLVKPDSGWMKYPKAMLFSRAMSQGSRIVAPELMAGAHTKEEAESITPDTFEEIESAPQPEAKPKSKALTKGKLKTEVPAEKAPPAEHPPEEAPPDEISPEIAAEIEGEFEIEGEIAPEIAAKAVPKVTRDPATVKSLTDMYQACFKDFSLQPAQVMKELNVKANSEITKTPWGCYLEIAAVYADMAKAEA